MPHDPFNSVPVPDGNDARFNTDGLSLEPIDGVPNTIFEQTAQEGNWPTTPDRGMVEVLNSAVEGETPQGIESGNDADPALAQMRASVNAAEIAASEAREQERTRKELDELFGDGYPSQRLESVPAQASEVEGITTSERAPTRNIEVVSEASHIEDEAVNEALDYLKLPDGAWGAENIQNISPSSSAQELQGALAMKELDNRTKRTKIRNTTLALGAVSGAGTWGATAAYGAAGLATGGIATLGIAAIGGGIWAGKKIYDSYKERKARKALALDRY